MIKKKDSMVIKRVSLREKAYNYLKDKIVQCEFLPGCPLLEKDLMAAVSVGRTPIREALLKLTEEQFVRIHPKRGIYVAEISLQDVIDVYTLREVVEPAAAGLAALTINPKDLEPFRSFWSEDDNRKSITEHIEKDREFHRALAEATKNKYFIQTLYTLYDQVNRIRFFTLSQASGRVDQAREEHLRIIERLLKRDVAGSEKTMKEHLRRANETARLQFPGLASRPKP